MQLLADPQIARSIRNPLVGTVFPFVAGSPGQAYHLLKNDASGNMTDAAAVEVASGNIGIGTLTPAFKLDVASAVGNGAQSYIRITDTTADVTGGLYGGVNANLVIGAQRAGFSDGAAGILDVTTNHPLFLKTNDQTRMTILGGGNVGIGTASPAEKLDVIGNIKSDGLNKIIFLRPLGGSSDDQPQIQAAINSLPSSGGIILLTPGTYRIGSTISVTNKNGIKIREFGGNLLDQDPEEPATVLVWTGGTSSNPVIKMLSNVSGTPVANAELSDLKIDAQSSAAIGLLLSYVTTSRFKNLLIKWSTDIGINLTTEIAEEHKDSLGNLFENCTVWGSPHGIVLDGKTVTSGNPAVTTYYGDTSQNIFVNTQIAYPGSNSGDSGIWLKYADANVFIRTTIWREGSQGYGVVIEDPQHSQANYFYHLAPGGGVRIKNADQGVSSEGKNMIFGYTIPEAAPTTDDPDVPPEKLLAWIDSMGNMSGFRLKHYSLTSALTTSNWPLVENNQMATCWDNAKFWLLVQESGNKWKLEMQQLT